MDENNGTSLALQIEVLQSLELILTSPGLLAETAISLLVRPLESLRMHIDTHESDGSDEDESSIGDPNAVSYGARETVAMAQSLVTILRDAMRETAGDNASAVALLNTRAGRKLICDEAECVRKAITYRRELLSRLSMMN